MKALVYYFAFPHYRKEIIENLVSISEGNVLIAAGTCGRADIKPLTSKDLESLIELETINIGPFSWQMGILRRAISAEFESVVLGPATTSLSTWAILIMRRLLRRKTYLWGQCGSVGERSIKRILLELMNNVATGLMVYGDSAKSGATELGLNEGKVDIVYNATRTNADFLDLDFGLKAFKRMQAAAALATTEGDVTLIYIGRLVPEKKVDVLLEAARISRAQYKNLKVVIVGGGPELESLQEQFPDDYIDFRGWIYDSHKLNAEIRDASFVVSPYHIGLLAVDALRVGTPVLYPDQPLNGPEMESLTPGVNSLVFTRGDSRALSVAINEWFSIAPEITQDQFVSARQESLILWSPENVAARILESIKFEQ